DLTSMGEANAGPDGSPPENGVEIVSHLDATAGVYKKLVLRENRLVGAILLEASDAGGRLLRLFRSGELVSSPAAELLNANARDALLHEGADADPAGLADDTQICNCHAVCKGEIVAAIRDGKGSIEVIGECTKAGTGCGTCQPLLGRLIHCFGRAANGQPTEVNKVERLKAAKDGLDSLPAMYRLAEANNWQEMSEDDKQRAKWHGLFFRTPTPGNFMLRLRLEAGKTNSRQFRLIADLSDEYGKGFCDLTTRQQIQLRWFT